MDTLKTSFLIVTSILITACSAPAFISVSEKDSAKISFSSLSDKLPALELSLRGKSYSISRQMIDIARHGEVDKKVFDIPVNEKIALTYETSGITDYIVSPVIQNYVVPNPGQTTPLVGHKIDFDYQYELNNCTTKFIFIPEKNKHYEAFAEQSNAKVCRIFVREVLGSDNDGHKTYKQLTSMKPVS